MRKVYGQIRLLGGTHVHKSLLTVASEWLSADTGNEACGWAGHGGQRGDPSQPPPQTSTEPSLSLRSEVPIIRTHAGPQSRRSWDGFHSPSSSPPVPQPSCRSSPATSDGASTSVSASALHVRCPLPANMRLNTSASSSNISNSNGNGNSRYTVQYGIASNGANASGYLSTNVFRRSISSSSNITTSSGPTDLPSLSPGLEARLRQLHSRCGQLEAMLAGSSAESGTGGGHGGGGSRSNTGRKYTQLKPLAAAYERLLSVRQELGDLAVLLRDADPRVREMAEEEGQQLRQQAAALTRQLLLALVPRDPRDARPALLEVRAGAGGLEAALFCGDLLEMYRKFAAARGWSWQVVEVTASELGGVKYATVAVSDGGRSAGAGEYDEGGGGVDDDDDGGGGGGGRGVYGTLLPESGVHRVQRVPATEAQGRVHTSTAAVVVLPQADEVDVRLRDEDMRIETMRASGAGGQHVNVTDSAVRITHLPSGLVVSCQNERSQHRNRMAALQVLRTKLYDMELQARARQMDEQRSAQVSSAERNERVRTYNFPQGRVTDHRLHLTLHLDSVMEGGVGLERLVRALAAAREEEALRRLAEEGEGEAGRGSGGGGGGGRT